MTESPAPRLSVRGIRRSFGSVVAVAGVDLDVRAGVVHALLGENGAGKSTLMNIVYGAVRPDAGTIAVDGQLTEIRSSADALAAGLAMVHQHHRLVPSLTVAETVLLASTMRGVRLDLGAAERRVRELVDELGLEVDPRARIRELSLGARQRVEILIAVHRNSTVLILDEPTAVLAPSEVDPLFALLRRMAADGCSIILITHRLSEVFAVTDAISVMRKGELIATLDTKDASRDQVLELVVTSPASRATRPLRPSPPSEVDRPVVLEVDDLRSAPGPGTTGLRGFSLEVRRGEVLGIAGVEGNGQDALVEILAGVRKADAGSIRVEGRPATPEARRHVVAIVPEDRQREGLVLDLSTSENIALPRLDTYSRWGFLQRARMRSDATDAIRSYEIVTPSPDAPVRSMSGGNQQKVVLARALGGEPRVLVVSQPTRGLDPGAAAAVLDRIRAAASAGTAVLFIGSDLDEVVGVSDRVAVMYRGTVAGVLDQPSKERSAIAGLMTGAQPGAVA